MFRWSRRDIIIDRYPTIPVAERLITWRRGSDRNCFRYLFGRVPEVVIRLMARLRRSGISTSGPRERHRCGLERRAQHAVRSSHVAGSRNREQLFAPTGNVCAPTCRLNIAANVAEDDVRINYCKKNSAKRRFLTSNTLPQSWTWVNICQSINIWY